MAQKSVGRSALIFVSLCTLPCCAALGQSAVITLAFPFGARAYSMGEVGTALADDESILYFNPAGLDVPNERWRGGAGCFFYEPLLPAFGLKELWHLSIAANFQDTSLTWGQFGIFVNHINMGLNQWTDDLGRVLGEARSYETVVALGWGFDFKEIGIKNHYFGLTAKWFRSALAPGFQGSGAANSLAFDLGYLWTIGKYLRFGATLMNMGPSIYYLDEEQRDPLPFTLNCAVAYKNTFNLEDLEFCSIAAELRLDKELVRNHLNRNPDPFYEAFFTEWTDSPLHEEFMEINEHLGAEITLLNTLSLRGGYLIDLGVERYEFHYGFGIKIFNHYSLDWGKIHSPQGYMEPFSQMFDPNKTGATGARDRQWQISFTVTGFFNQSENDQYWWRAKR